MFTSKSLEVKYVYRHAGLACLGTTLTTAVARLKPAIFVGDRVSQVKARGVFFLKYDQKIQKRVRKNKKGLKDDHLDLG